MNVSSRECTTIYAHKIIPTLHTHRQISSLPGTTRCDVLEPPIAVTIHSSSAERPPSLIVIICPIPCGSFGYDYLIEPMINAGGFSTVSERMGIGMNVRTLKNEIEHERIDPLATFKVPETDGYLTLGR